MVYPIKFSEANKNLLKPDDMTDEECKSLSNPWQNTPTSKRSESGG